MATSKSISAGEQRFVEDEMLRRNDVCVFMDWVRKKKDKKIEKRLIVIGKYRILTIKRSYTGAKSVQRDGHIYTLREVVAETSSSCKLVFTDFKFVFDSNQVPQFIYAIHTAIKSIFYDFPPRKLPIMTICKEVTDSKPLPEYCSPGPASNFAEIYRAYCNYGNTLPQRAVLAQVEDAASSENRSLDLAQCVGASSMDFDLGPIFLALRHNSYFTCISLQNVPRKEVLSMAAGVLKENFTVQTLILSDVDGTRGSYDLGQSLASNENIGLSVLDLSKNKLGEEAIGLADGLEKTSARLTKLDLSDCALNKEQMHSILDKLANNSNMEGMLDLDLSDNEFDKIANDSLVVFLKQLKKLEYIGLAGTGVSVSDTLQFITDRFCNCIVDVNLSRNKFTKGEVQSVVGLINMSKKLAALSLNHCNLTEEMFETILTAVGSNTNINQTKFKLEAAGNELGAKKQLGTVCVQRAITSTKNLCAVNIRDNKFKLEDFIDVVESIGSASHIRDIDVGCFKGQGGQRIVESIVKLIHQSTSLKSINISSTDGKTVYGKELGHLFQQLQTAHVEMIDISNNRAGHSVINLLCLALRVNESLKTIIWDNNLMTMETFESLDIALDVNKTLADVEYPDQDINRLLASAKDREKMREALGRVWISIAKKLRRNLESTGKGSERPYDTWRSSGRIQSMMIGKMSFGIFDTGNKSEETKPVIGDITWTKKDGLNEVVEYHTGSEETTPAVSAGTPPPQNRGIPKLPAGGALAPPSVPSQGPLSPRFERNNSSSSSSNLAAAAPVQLPSPAVQPRRAHTNAAHIGESNSDESIDREEMSQRSMTAVNKPPPIERVAVLPSAAERGRGRGGMRGGLSHSSSESLQTMNPPASTTPHLSPMVARRGGRGGSAAGEKPLSASFDANRAPPRSPAVARSHSNEVPPPPLSRNGSEEQVERKVTNTKTPPPPLARDTSLDKVDRKPSRPPRTSGVFETIDTPQNTRTPSRTFNLSEDSSGGPPPVPSRDGRRSATSSVGKLSRANMSERNLREGIRPPPLPRDDSGINGVTRCFSEEE